MIFTGELVKEVLRDEDEGNWVASAGGGFWGQLPNEGNGFDSLRGSSI